MTLVPALRACALALLLSLGIGASAAAAQPAPAAPRATAPIGADADPGVKPWQVVTAVIYLAILGGVGFALVRLSRRGFAVRPSKAGEGPIKALGSTRVSPTVTVTLLEVEGRRVLVAASPSGTSMIEMSKHE